MDDFNEGLQKLGKTLIPETELATPNGAKFDPNELRARKTPLDKILIRGNSALIEKLAKLQNN